jgi:small ligand-binding sensory domain FIST
MAMARFPVAHATHPQWAMAVSLVVAQLESQLHAWHAQHTQHALQASHAQPSTPKLGLVYFTDHLAAHAEAMHQALASALPEVSSWVGTVAHGVLADEAEYWDEPALAVMLCDVPESEFAVFSGVSPLPSHFDAHTALVHADPEMTELGDNVRELAARMASGAVFGALSTSRARVVQVAHQPGQDMCESVLEGGLSGVAFTHHVAVHSRITHGCKPIGRERVVTEASRHLLLALDGEPALALLLNDLRVSLDQPREALLAVRGTRLAINRQPDAQRRYAGQLPAAAHVRSLVGVDPGNSALALAETVEEGATVTFCQRDAAFARADLTRMCAELRESLEPEALDARAVSLRLQAQTEAQALHAVSALGLDTEQIAGAVYISCASRGGGYFGAPGAELHILRHALGRVPLIGLLAGGEIAHDNVHGLSGVLTVFVKP